MAETLNPITWVQDDPAVLDQFSRTEVDGTTFYVAGCEAFTAEQLGVGVDADGEAGSEAFTAKQGGTGAKPRGATKNRRSPWKDGVVPYRYVGSFTDSEKRVFLKATDLWTAAAGRNSRGRQTLIFVDDIEAAFPQYLRVKKGSGNNEASNGSVPAAYLKIAIFDVGSIAHELGHVLGLVHEHQRSDRNEYVLVSNAVDGNANFRLHGTAEDTIRTEYDFGSIMHYGGKVLLDGNRWTRSRPSPVMSSTQDTWANAPHPRLWTWKRSDSSTRELG